MNTLPTPTKTPMALQWLEARDARDPRNFRDADKSERVKRALLSNIDGHRNVIELESFARAMGLAPDALQRLRGEGLIDLAD